MSKKKKWDNKIEGMAGTVARAIIEAHSGHVIEVLIRRKRCDG